MNKKIELKNNIVLLFFANIGILLSMLFFKWYFTSLGFITGIVNIFFILNIILFLLGCLFIILFIKRINYYDEKKSIKVIIIVLIIYLLLNTVGIYLINMPLSKGYKKIAEELSSYCQVYRCDRYETINEKKWKNFIIKKTYFDYNNLENNIEIHTKYNNNYIIEIHAFVSSKKELFSERLIKDELDGYFSNFNIKIEEKLIKEAFDNRKKGSIKKNNVIYKVSEVYKDNSLDELKTEIKVILKQG